MSQLDVQCVGCKKTFGWSGTCFDIPACPHCGSRENTLAAEDVTEIVKFRAFLRDRARVRDEQHPQASVSVERETGAKYRPPRCPDCHWAMSFVLDDCTGQGGPPANTWLCGNVKCGKAIDSYDPRGKAVCLPPEK